MNVEKETPLTKFQVVLLGNLFTWTTNKGLKPPAIVASIKSKFDESGTYVDLTCSFNSLSLWIYYDGAGLSDKDNVMDERFERAAYRSDDEMIQDVIATLNENFGRESV